MADIKIYADNVEEEALRQIDEISRSPAFSGSKIRIMPDVHAGKGCVIGFTADIGDRVIPNVVGVDIGCGVYCVLLGKIDIDLEKLDRVIHATIPTGREVRSCGFGYERLNEMSCRKRLKDTLRINMSLGTLGGGNHFIEVDEDEDGCKYLVIHTGSRNLGKQVAEIYQKMAYEDMQGRDSLSRKITETIALDKINGRQKEIQGDIEKIKAEWECAEPDCPKDLCYLTGEHRLMYLSDMRECQRFAYANREKIADTIIDAMGWDDSLKRRAFDTMHNYIGADNIVRKGAISAKKNEEVIIPLNMRDGCILGVGKGNPDWNNSAPHGAGRRMSRRKAREDIPMDEFRDSMAGIYTTSVAEATVDESPMAYKQPDDILKYLPETVDIVKRIRPVYSFKDCSTEEKEREAK